MNEFAKRFLDKECLIESHEGDEFDGVIREVNNGALLLEKDGKVQAINLAYVVRIREYPQEQKKWRKFLSLD